MPKQAKNDTLARIEESQAALRDSIDKARTLADESDRLIKRHRDEIARPGDSST
ncbi:MAG TPA: hypothetical protein VFO69_14280 [Allosphingosinicella sp.]|nr:hypothetical protein [Allosphingosinicella sp.]